MLTVDGFESAFRSADKKRFHYNKPKDERVLVITDLSGDELSNYVEAAQELMAPTAATEWDVHGIDSWSGVEGVVKMIEESEADIICTYRNMRSDAWRWSYSLGVYLNAMNRITKRPVMVTPNPHFDPTLAWRKCQSDSIMVATDHLTGDDVLTNWGLTFTRPSGTLHLTHLEHAQAFERFIGAVAKTPDIDTDVARSTLLSQLLKEPKDYIASVADVMAELKMDIRVEEHVMFGKGVPEYRQAIVDLEVDVAIFPALEEERVGLNGIAYSLAVELTNIPVVMV